MLISDVCKGRELPLLQSSRLWMRAVETLSSLDLTVFLRASQDAGDYSHALREVNCVIDATWDAVFSGAVSKAPRFLYFEPGVPRLTIDELIRGLDLVSVERRRAILFALETGDTLETVVALTHAELARLHLGEFAMELAHATPRNIAIPNVFWETSPATGRAMPLVGLERSATEVGQGVDFDGLRRLYRGLLPFDLDSDRVTFMELLGI